MLEIKQIIRPRQTGKTRELIKKSAEMGYPIICKSKSICKLLKQKAEKLNLEIPDPISIDDVLNNKHNHDTSYNRVLVDDAEFILDMLINRHVAIGNDCHIDTYTCVTTNHLGHEVNAFGEDIIVKYAGGE